MRNKDKQRKKDPVGWGGGKLTEHEVEDAKKKTLPPGKSEERKWKEGERY